MRTKKLSLATAISVGVVSAISALTPAQAAIVEGCGEASSGVTLTNEGAYCQAFFASVGEGQLTLPSGVSDLFGIVVAGGGGVAFNGSGGFGYAGDGGEAKYLNWTNLADSAEIVVSVGAAGVSSETGAATAGGSTTVTSAGQTTFTSAGGAIGGNTFSFCSFSESYSTYVGLGVSGTGVVPGPYVYEPPADRDDQCEPEGMPGLNPATDVAAPDLFQYLPANYGKGGGVYAAAPTPTNFGEGSSVLVITSDSTVATSPAQRGTVILRYAAVSAGVNPTITSIVPNEGLTSGSTPITITGTLFANGATVSVGGNACTSVVVVSDTTITCLTPVGTAGAKNVVVTNTDAGTVTSASAFTYTAPVVNAPSSSSGPAITYRSVLFDPNGGTGTTPTVSSYTAFALPAHALLKPGFVFTSWNTKADGTGIAYSDKGTYTFNSDATLYAQWVPIKAAVKIKQYISTFAGDKATLTTKMKTTIAGWVKKLPKNAVITCQGSTSGSKVTAFDKRLASNRAKNVCVEAVKRRADLTYSIKLNPSSATKVSARHVWMIQN